MKFEEKLKAAMLSRWRVYYVDYGLLKSMIRENVNEDAFRQELSAQIQKVNAHVLSEEARLAAAAESFDLHSEAASPFEATMARSQALFLANEELRAYVELCYTGMYKACKKFDKYVSKVKGTAPISSDILANVELEHFMQRLLPSISGSFDPPPSRDASRTAASLLHSGGNNASSSSSSSSSASSSSSLSSASPSAPTTAASQDVLASFDAIAAKAMQHAAASLESLALRSAAIDGEEGESNGWLQRLEGAISSDARAPLVEAILEEGQEAASVAHAPPPSGPPSAKLAAASLAARSQIFSSVARMMAKAVALTSPEGALGVEQLLQMHTVCLQSSPEATRMVKPSPPSMEAMSSMATTSRKRLLAATAAVLDNGILSEGGGGAPSPAPPPPHTWYTRACAVARFLAPASFSWLPSYKIRSWLLKDTLAGLTIGVLLVPQGLAYAGLAGLPRFRGLYTGLPPAIYTGFGTSRHGAVGPQSIPALLIGESLATFPVEGYVEAVGSITFLVGALLFVAGWLQLGFIVRFISRPVLSGFAAGSAILTMASSFKDVLGVAVPRSPDLYTTIRDLVSVAGATEWPCVVTSAVAMALLLALPYIPYIKRLPAGLVVTVFAIAVMATWMRVAGIEGTPEPGKDDGPNAEPNYRGPGGIPLVGSVPSTLPTFELPRFHADTFPTIIQSSLAVALVGFIESVAVAQTYSVEYGYDISPTSELKALGLTNMLGGTLRTLPVMAAFGRSSVNAASGAQTPLTQAIAALTVVILVSVASPALYYLPQAVLTCVIIRAVAGLLDYPFALRLWRGDKKDFLCLLASLLATVGLGVLYGVLLAVLISLVLFVASATRSTVGVMGRIRGTANYARIDSVGLLVTPLRTVRVLHFDAPLWFANAPTLRAAIADELREREDAPPRLRWSTLVLDCSSISFMDSSAALMLEEIVSSLVHPQRIPFLLTGLQGAPRASLKGFGIIDKLGGLKFIRASVHEALNAIATREVSAADLPPIKGAAASVGGGGGGH